MKAESYWLILLLIVTLSLAIRLKSDRRHKWPFWKKNIKQIAIISVDKDKEDLIQLNRLKQSNGTNAFNGVIQSSIENFDENQDGRQDGTCTCASTSFVCSPTISIDGFSSVDTSVTVIVSSCSASSTCSTVCTSISTSCSSSCTISTSLTATYYTSYLYCSGAIYGNSIIPTSYTTSAGSSTSSSTTIYSSGCQSLSTACSTTTINRLARAAFAAAAAAVAIAVGVGAGVRVAQGAEVQQIIALDTEQQVLELVNDFLLTGAEDNSTLNENATINAFVPITALTPSNLLPIPVTGVSGPNFRNGDGCGDESILFDDGNCYPLLRRGPCPDLRQWLTVDPFTLRGRCSPRLCARGRVFVGRDGLCHDVDDPIDCRGGRRLYYTAYGDPICDCPRGQFPFPTPRDNCVTIFTQGPCPVGHVVTFNSIGALICSCNGGKQQIGRGPVQSLLTSDGFTYPLGSSGPCPNSSFLDFDVFQLKTNCSSQNSFNEDFVFTDFDLYHQKSFSLVDSSDAHQPSYKVKTDVTAVPDKLFNPCRPGSRNGNNFKCTNSFLSNKRIRTIQAVRADFSCSSGGTLQATGLCKRGIDANSASCGPSYVYEKLSGQCKQIFF